MVSFEWSFICACMPFLDSPLLQVLTDDSAVMLCDFRTLWEAVTFLNVVPKDESTMPPNPALPSKYESRSESHPLATPSAPAPPPQNGDPHTSTPTPQSPLFCDFSLII